MVINDLLVLANVLLSSAIVVRLMLFRNPALRYQWWAAWLAYLMIVAYASVPFRYLFAHYTHTHWASVMINAIFCAAVYRANGNIAHIFRVLKTGTSAKK